MDHYLTQTPSINKLIKGIFYILFTATILGIYFFFTLKINNTAEASSGFIVSENVSMKYLTPTECQIQKVFIKEGDLVKAGDTLVILKNNKVIEDIAKTETSLRAAKRKMGFHQKQLNNLKRKIEKQIHARSIVSDQYINKNKGNENEVINIKNQYNILEDKLKVSNARLARSQELFEKGGISKREYDKIYQDHMDEVSSLNQKKSELTAKFLGKGDIETELAQSTNDLNIDILNLESEQLEQQNAIQQELLTSKQLMATLTALRKDLDQLIIIADKEGYVVNLYNAENELNRLPKNETILFITPTTTDNYYAKLSISENEIKDILPGMPVHIKLKAYNHYQFGVIHGEVIQVHKEIANKKATQSSMPGTSETFYVLVDIPKDDKTNIILKNGYKISGEIILSEVKLSQFVYNSMFKTMGG